MLNTRTDLRDPILCATPIPRPTSTYTSPTPRPEQRLNTLSAALSWPCSRLPVKGKSWRVRPAGCTSRDVTGRNPDVRGAASSVVSAFIKYSSRNLRWMFRFRSAKLVSVHWMGASAVRRQFRLASSLIQLISFPDVQQYEVLQPSCQRECDSRIFSTRTRHRSPVSCARCRRLKVRCDRQYPCGRCSGAGKNDECDYSHSSKASRQSPAGSSNSGKSAWHSRFLTRSHWALLVEDVIQPCVLSV